MCFRVRDLDVRLNCMCFLQNFTNSLMLVCIVGFCLLSLKVKSPIFVCKTLLLIFKLKGQ